MAKSAIDVGVKIEGAADLYKALQAIGVKIAPKAMRRGVKKAMVPVLNDMRQNLVRQGATETYSLLESLGTKIKTYKNSEVTVGLVGVQTEKKGKKNKKGKPKTRLRTDKHRLVRNGKVLRDPIKYAHLVEFGTRAHAVGKGSQIKRLDGRKTSGKQSGGKHPGTKARPFIRPAIDKNRSQIETTIADELRKTLKRETKKAAKAAGKK